MQHNSPVPEFLKRILLWQSFHLDEIAPAMGMVGIGQVMGELCIVGEEKQALTVGVEAAGGINVRGERAECTKGNKCAGVTRWRVGCEPGQHTVWLEEKKAVGVWVLGLVHAQIYRFPA
jgi:hypothetical protein